MKRLKFLAIIALTLSPICSQQILAQKTYTLAECQQMALKQNTAVRQASIDIDMAQERVQSARAHYLPTVTGSAVAFQTSDGVAQVGLPSLPIIGSLGTIDLAKNGVAAGINAIMPLYSGGIIHNSNKLAELDVAVNKMKLDKSADDVKLTTAKYYWQVVLLKEKLKTIDVIDTMLASLEHKVDMAVKAGVTLRNDMLKVNLKQNELQSSRLQVTNGIITSSMLLSQFIGLGLDTINTAYEMDYTLPPSPLSLYVTPQEAVSHTPEFQLLNQKIKAEELQQRITLGKNLPIVAIGAGANFENVTLSDYKYSSKFGINIDKSIASKHTFAIGFATVIVPITQWIGGTHDVRRQKAAVAKAKMERDDKAELMRLNMISHWNTLNESYNQLTVCLKSIEQSKENLRLQTNQYQAGLCTISDLLEAETLFQQSRDLFAEHMVTYQIRMAEYLRSIGE